MDEFVLSLDPGGTTGWALGKYSDTDPLTFVDGGQIDDGVAGFVKWFRDTRNWCPPAGEIGMTIVSESFTLRPGVKSPDLTPVRIEGALTALLGPDMVVYQQPARKAQVGDERLKRNGLWIPGQRHQMDARIHGLAYMLSLMHGPTIHAYWPMVEGN